MGSLRAMGWGEGLRRSKQAAGLVNGHNVVWPEAQRVDSSTRWGFRSGPLPGPLRALMSVGLWVESLFREDIQVTALGPEERSCMARGHCPAGSPPASPRQEAVGVGAQASQLLKDDLNLAVKLPHVQQEGDMVAVMPDDVVVHVDQDSGRGEKRCA